MATPSLVRRRRQIRSFVLVWTAITFVMGACTFVAIYATYGALAQNLNGQRSRLALPTTSATLAVVAPTPIPTRQVAAAAPTATPRSDTSAQSQPPTEQPTVGPTATLLPIDDKGFHVGIQVQYSLDLNPQNQDLWMNEVKNKLHMDWFKQQVRWEDVEPERGQYDWSKLDLTMPSAGRFGLKTMMSIVTAPNWSREPGVNLDKHGPPANNADYVNFVTAILRRYPGQVHAIEVWNEQNLDREWTSVRGLSAANYVALLRDTYTAVKAIDPGIIVISGALSPTGGWTEPDGRVSAIDDFDYMTQLIQAGMLNYSDCVGVHHNGYNIGPSVPWDKVPPDPTAKFRGPFDNPHHSWSFYSTLQTYANKIAVAGGNQKLCVTEFGWAVTEDLGGYPRGFEFANDNTLEEQKTWTVEALENMREWDFVWLAFIWNLNYGPQAGWDANNDNVPYSIIGKDWNFRPVYDAIIQWQLAYQQATGRR